MYTTKGASFRASTLFVYALTVAVLAFTARSWGLYILAVINFTLGITFSYKNGALIKLFLLFTALTIWGVFLSSLITANIGEPLVELGFLVIRGGVFKALINIGARLTSIMGSTLVFLSLTNPYSTLRSLENDLKLPKFIVFPVAYALRLLPLIKKDYEEVMLCKKQRGFGKTPLTPVEVLTTLRPLLSLSYERALWTGVAAELRGLGLRRPWRERCGLKTGDFVVYFILFLQILFVIALR